MMEEKLVIRFLLCLLLLCTSSVFAKKKLKIITESKPSDCTAVAEDGDTLVVHYTGSLESGLVFDSSRERDPFPVMLGAGQVIKGWDEGLVGMCQGEIRKLIIPPHLAYGDTGVQNIIPGGSTLHFTVELIELQKKPLMKLPNSQFWFYAGIVAVVALLGYELYKRGSKKEEKTKEVTSTKKKASKKRK